MSSFVSNFEITSSFCPMQQESCVIPSLLRPSHLVRETPNVFLLFSTFSTQIPSRGRNKFIVCLSVLFCHTWDTLFSLFSRDDHLLFVRNVHVMGKRESDAGENYQGRKNKKVMKTALEKTRQDNRKGH